MSEITSILTLILAKFVISVVIRLKYPVCEYLVYPPSFAEEGSVAESETERDETQLYPTTNRKNVSVSRECTGR